MISLDRFFSATTFSASQDDEDASATATKGDAFDQIQNPESPTAGKKADSDVSKALKESLDGTKENTSTDAATEGADQPSDDSVTPAPSSSKHANLPKKAAHQRKSASTFKQGFKTTKEDGECVMYSSADKSSSQILTVKGAKKLWVEQDSDEWFKAYHKKGSGFLSTDCFE